MGEGDLGLVNSYLVPERRWIDWPDRPPRNVLENVQCRLRPETSAPTAGPLTNAVAVCQFDVLEDWSGFSAGHVDPWGVWLRRAPSGPWLVYDWGVPV